MAITAETLPPRPHGDIALTVQRTRRWFVPPLQRHLRGQPLLGSNDLVEDIHEF